MKIEASNYVKYFFLFNFLALSLVYVFGYFGINSFPFLASVLLLFTSIKYVKFWKIVFLLVMLFFLWFQFFLGLPVSLLSSLNFFLTFFLLIFFSFDSNRLEANIKFIIRLTSFFCFFSFALNIAGFITKGGVGGDYDPVILISRLYFPFPEPSLLAIFLTLVMFLPGFSSSENVDRFIISAAFLFCWSLSGFLLFFLLFFFEKVVDRVSIKGIVSALFLIYFLVYFWNNFLFSSEFWIVSKVDSLLLLGNGNDVVVNSAFVRSESTKMGVNYLIMMFQERDWLHLFMGQGIGGYSEWLADYYYKLYGIKDLTAINNFISVLIVSSGVLGTLLILLMFFLLLHGSGKGKKIKFFYVFFVVSLFSGYSSGNLALLFYFMMMMVSLKNERK